MNNYGKDERPQYNTFSVKESFTQSLMEQLGFRNLSEHEHDVAAFIIGSLDDDGYLRRDIGSLVDDLAFRMNITTDEEEVERLLRIIQDFEPSGVGARDLRECLLIQLKALKQSEDVVNAERILTDWFHEFSTKHFQKIMMKLGLSEKEMKAAMARIVKLNPSLADRLTIHTTTRPSRLCLTSYWILKTASSSSPCRDSPFRKSASTANMPSS